MTFNFTARLIILQIIPKIDLQARLQRFNQNTPANVLERCIFNIFDFLLCLCLCLSFLFKADFRDRVYYLYQHPDHDDSDCLYPRITWRLPNTTKWVIYFFPKVMHFWRNCIQVSRDLMSLVPTYKSSPSFFGMSPRLAVVIHGAGKWAANSKIPNGCVMDLFLSFSYLLSRFCCLQYTFFFTTWAIGLSEYIMRLVSNVAGINLIPNSNLCLLSIWPSLVQVLTWSRCTKSGDSSRLR